MDRDTGAVYLVWQDSRFGPRSSIAFSQSLDGGLTWSSPIKVNQTPDLANNLNEQAFTPMVQVLDDGTVGVSYYDFRSNTADNGATTPTEAFVALMNDAAEEIGLGLDDLVSDHLCRLLAHMDGYWELLFAHLLNFRFAYPTERDRVPGWLMTELTGRLQAQVNLPAPRIKVCRGRLFSPRDYIADITEWGFGDIVGKGLAKPEAMIEAITRLARAGRAYVQFRADFGLKF